MLHLDFGNSGVTAKVQIEPANDHVILRVVDVTGNVDSLRHTTREQRTETVCQAGVGPRRASTIASSAAYQYVRSGFHVPYRKRGRLYTSQNGETK